MSTTDPEADATAPVLRGAALDAWVRACCPNCLRRPRTPGFTTCSPCFYRPAVHRVRWSEPAPGRVVCPHGRTGHCDDCPEPPRASETARTTESHTPRPDRPPMDVSEARDGASQPCPPPTPAKEP